MTGTRSAPAARGARKSGSELVADTNGPTTSELAQAETSLAGKLRVSDAHNTIAARHDRARIIDSEHRTCWRERLPFRDIECRGAGTEQFDLHTVERCECARLWIERAHGTGDRSGRMGPVDPRVITLDLGGERRQRFVLRTLDDLSDVE